MSEAGEDWQDIRANMPEMRTFLARGGRVVRFQFCISLLVLTLRRESEIVLVPARGWAFLRGIPYSLISVFLGWWAVPWGVVLTPLVLWGNLLGGRDVTEDVRSEVESSEPLPPEFPPD